MSHSSIIMGLLALDITIILSHHSPTNHLVSLLYQLSPCSHSKLPPIWLSLHRGWHWLHLKYSGPLQQPDTSIQEKYPQTPQQTVVFFKILPIYPAFRHLLKAQEKILSTHVVPTSHCPTKKLDAINVVIDNSWPTLG